MVKEEEFDLDEEVKIITRKSKINMQKTEYSYQNRLKELDKEIDKVVSDQIKSFDDNRKSTEEFEEIEFKHETINRYREKLRKI